MRLLVLQLVPGTRGRPVPRFDPQLGILLTLLERRAHQLALAGLARFDLEPIKAAMAQALPQLIYADISPVCLDLARRTFEYIQRREFVPIVTGGALPTLDPAAALSLPGVQAAAIGEPDASLVTYLERMKDPAAGQLVSGVWLRDERGLARPARPPVVEDLNSLPFAHRELFGCAEHVARTGEIEIAVGRGCPRACTYCPNEALAEVHAGGGTWVRRRSPPNILAEINQVRERFRGVQRVRFLDHAFALDPDWLSEYLDAHVRLCELPFRCHLRAGAADEDLVRRLAGAGCQFADVEVISASDFIRNEIFEMGASNAQIRALFEWLRTAGVRTRAIVYLGAPYESEASLDETGRLLAELRPDVADVRPYYPWPGTRARALAQEQGWLHARGEEQYHEDRCGLDMPACRAETVAAFIRRLRSDLSRPEDAPWWRRMSRGALGQVFNRKRV